VISLTGLVTPIVHAVACLLVLGALAQAGVGPGAGVANDLCEEALPIGPTSLFHWTRMATSEGSSTCASGVAAPDVWYRYTPATNGTVTLQTCGSTTFDTVLSLHSGCPGTVANEIACNDNGCSVGPYSRLQAPVMAGTAYFIRVSGANGASGGFQLLLSGPISIPAPNASPNRPMQIGPGTHFGYIRPLLGPLGCLTITEDAWFTYRPTSSGTMNLSTCFNETEYDTLLNVYEDGVPYACVDDSCGLEETVALPVVSGRLYLIRVGGRLHRDLPSGPGRTSGRKRRLCRGRGRSRRDLSRQADGRDRLGILELRRRRPARPLLQVRLAL
jgi:hypothetical protein